MIVIKKRLGCSLAEIWFSTPMDFSARKYVACKYNNMLAPSSNIDNGYIINTRDAQTLVSDLSHSDEEILHRCASNVRNEIRRAKKDGVECTVYSSNSLIKMDNILQEFDEVYNEMNMRKGLKTISVLRYLRTLRKEDVLYVSHARIDNKTAAYHVYITGDDITRLLYSVSVFRDYDEHDMRNSIGRANRLLHYEDMLYFKSINIHTYDWGGYSSDHELDSINAFKAGFGGELVPRFYTMFTSYRLVYLIYKLRRKL